MYIRTYVRGAGRVVRCQFQLVLRLATASLLSKKSEDLCAVRITVQGPFFEKQGTVRKVDAEWNVEVAAITSDVSTHQLLTHNLD